MKIEGAAKVPAGGAPEFGEHTRQILAELGYPEHKIRELIEKGTAFQS